MLTKPDFTAVARAIANPAPEWLVPALAHFQDVVGSEVTSDEAHDHLRIFAQMHDAAGKLIAFLPMYLAMPTAARSDKRVRVIQEQVRTALGVLPAIKANLADRMNEPPRKGGPRPNVPRHLCAAVVVEAWSLIHGKAQPRSNRLYRACNEYWQACGQEYRSEGWRWDVKDAIDEPQQWVRDSLTRYKSQSLNPV
jgi:hypothetical protein